MPATIMLTLHEQSDFIFRAQLCTYRMLVCLFVANISATEQDVW